MSDQIEHVKTILKELVGRTKDFQNLNAFRLFILQHNTYDVDKATMLIKRGKWQAAWGRGKGQSREEKVVLFLLR